MGREFSTPRPPACSEPFPFSLCFSFPCFLPSFLQICPFVFNNFHDTHPATLFFLCFCIVAGGGYAPATKTLHKNGSNPKNRGNHMIDTLNPEAPATSAGPEVPQSAAASIPAETPQHSPSAATILPAVTTATPTAGAALFPAFPLSLAFASGTIIARSPLVFP